MPAPSPAAGGRRWRPAGAASMAAGLRYRWRPRGTASTSPACARRSTRRLGAPARCAGRRGTPGRRRWVADRSAASTPAACLPVPWRPAWTRSGQAARYRPEAPRAAAARPGAAHREPLARVRRSAPAPLHRARALATSTRRSRSAAPPASRQRSATPATMHADRVPLAPAGAAARVPAVGAAAGRARQRVRTAGPRCHPGPCVVH